MAASKAFRDIRSSFPKPQLPGFLFCLPLTSVQREPLRCRQGRAGTVRSARTVEIRETFNAMRPAKAPVVPAPRTRWRETSYPLQMEKLDTISTPVADASGVRPPPTVASSVLDRQTAHRE